MLKKLFIDLRFNGLEYLGVYVGGMLAGAGLAIAYHDKIADGMGKLFNNTYNPTHKKDKEEESD